MKKPFLLLATVLILSGLLLNAPTASATSWTNWTTIASLGANGSASGSIVAGADTVDVSLSGLIYQFVDGDTYYNNANTGYTSPTGTYGGLKPSDMIQESYSGRVTITFDQAVVNPYIALVSVGQGGLPVSYGFSNLQNPIEVVSYGSNYWGYSGYAINGDTFTGREFNGILRLTGTYSQLIFDISPNEFWHGFNIGIDSVAQDSEPVPEPATMVLLGLGLTGLFGTRRKK
jgi:hypothetical protein